MTSPNVRPITEWITVAEAAVRLHRTTKTIRTWIKDGTIPAHQLSPGGHYLIDAHELDELVRSRCSVPIAGDAA